QRRVGVELSAASPASQQRRGFYRDPNMTLPKFTTLFASARSSSALKFRRSSLRISSWISSWGFSGRSFGGSIGPRSSREVCATQRESGSATGDHFIWHRLPAFIALAATVAAPASAEGVTATLRGSYIETIQSGGVTVPRADLRTGISSGAVLEHPWGSSIRSVDGRNLESYFIRNNTPGTWDVQIGSYSPSAGPAADFFLFEVGGNDPVLVRPILANGSVGASVPLSGWTATGLNVDGGPNGGSPVQGLAFRFEDLKRGNGSFLSPGDSITGLRFESSSLDAASFLIRDTGYHAGNDGDGSHFITPAAPSMSAPMELTFRGPWTSETAESPNPFLDYRLNVIMRGPGGRVYVVPGFFDADGADGDVGNFWKVRFTPPVTGQWTATASMRFGAGVAIDLSPAAGTRLTPVDGRVATFQVGGVRGDERGFYRVGKLAASGKHYRKFENGSYFLKAGTNGPENFLAIRACDDATKSGGEGLMHSYAPHRADWNAGDPLLDEFGGDEDGKGVIGALNYLKEQGVNSIFMMVMNLGGDGKDVYPFLGPRRRSFEKRHYDTSRLRQWNTIFEHAQRCGISLSLVMNETEPENETWLDNGQLGVERKLYYRELVARFGHHPAIRWNICEENDFSLSQLQQFASFISSQDYNESTIAIHNNPNDLALFQALASNPLFDTASLQFDPNQADSQVEFVRELTAQAGRPWVVDADEQGPWQTGVTDLNTTDTRKRILYDALFSGGGVEFYFGYHPLPLGGDLSVEDFSTREGIWTAVKHARAFMEGQLPFWDMTPDDSLVRNESGAFGGAEVFAKAGEVYAIYYPNTTNAGQLNLGSNAELYFVEWFNPRTGEFVGDRAALGTGGGWKNLGAPPADPSNDWVALVRPQAPLWSRTNQGSVSQGTVQSLELRLGSSYAGRNYFLLSSLSTSGGGFLLGGTHVAIDFDRWTRYAISDVQGRVFDNQIGTLDSSGAAAVTVTLDATYVGGLVGVTMYHSAVLTQPYDFATNVVTLRVMP
ncbi:MAG: hypothetical protein ACI80K_002184, partial [Paracoccaceae bacterium]